MNMKSVADRFWSYVDKFGTFAEYNHTRCWLWTRCHNDKGYGLFDWQGNLSRAHRVAWRLTHGTWPSKFALHRCDTRGCVRPSHLFNGTQADNMKDMESKGRSTHGAKHASAVLTTKQVVAIRAQLRKGAPQRFLSNKYNVSQTTISDINTRKAWKHAEEIIQCQKNRD
jgi:hypothetical protein